MSEDTEVQESTLDYTVRKEAQVCLQSDKQR